MTIEDLRNDDDWRAAFNEAGMPMNPLTRGPLDGYGGIEDVMRIVASVDGENDGNDWLGVFELRSGRYVAVRAGCDYTGWGCRASGSAEWTETEAEAIACLTDAERERLGLTPAP